MDWKSTPGLPEETVETLTGLLDELVPLLEDGLRSVVLYGDLARGEYHPVAPGIELLLVIDPLDRAQLEAIARPMRRARWRMDIGFLVLSSGDLAGSTDVFPILFADLKEHHILLYGDDLVAALAIGREHLRLRSEQQLRSVLWRLRRQFMFVSDYAERLQATLCEGFSTFLVTIGGSLRARGLEPARSSEERLAQVVAQFAVDGAVLETLLSLRDKVDAELPVDELRQLHWQFADLLVSLIRQVDVESYPV